MRHPSRRTVLCGALGCAGLLALGGCSGPAPPEVDRLRLATGPAGAVYREMGGALAQVWNEVWGREVVEVVPTDASVDNRDLLLAGEVQLGFVNVDVGQADRDRLPALLRVFDSVVHLVVREDSPVTSMADLQGRRVALGLPGSGTRFTCERLLENAGVSVEVESLSQADAAEAIVDGEVEAVFSLTAMPTPALTWLLEESGHRYRFVDLQEPSAGLQAAHPGEYLSVTISSAVYPGVSPANSLAVSTLLLTIPELSDDLARFLTSTVIEQAETLRERRPEAGQINPRTAVATAPIPLHPGAADYFRSVKP